MQVEQVVVGPFEVNCWVVWGDSKQALVIDPGDDAELVAETLDLNQLTVAAYLLTHGHMDHVSAVAELCATRPAPVALHASDATWAFTEANVLPPCYTSTPVKPDRLERTLAEGQEWSDGGLDYKVLETPGHTPGSVCLLFSKEKALFSGDTLFAGSIGRTDFPGGSARTMTQSLRRLKDIDDNVVVYAGHGPKTSMRREKSTNFFLRT